MGTNYSGLQAQVSGLLNRRDATNSQIQGYIQLGLQRIQRELRCPAMEEIVQVTIPTYTLPFAGITIPADLIELIDLIDPWGHRITKEDITTVMQYAKTVGRPWYYYRYGGVWLLGHAPPAGTIITVVYYGEIGQLVNGTDENIITDIAPDLIAYASLGYAADFYSDKRGDGWEQRYQQILTDIQDQSDDDETSGGSTVSPAYMWADDSIGT